MNKFNENLVYSFAIIFFFGGGGLPALNESISAIPNY